MKHTSMFRKLFAIIMLLVILPCVTQAQFFDKLKKKANDVINQKTDKKVDDVLDGKKSSTPSSSNDDATTTTTTATTAENKPTLSAYRNYDFVPGDKIIFEDHFDTDEEGEFPSHWNLVRGQGTMNTFDGHKMLLLTQNDTRIAPAIKSSSYLTDSFTIEFDNYSKDDFGPEIWFYKAESEINTDNAETAKIIFDDRFWNLRVKPKDGKGETVVTYPPPIDTYAKYNHKWHHIAVAYKNKRLKIYVDEFRVASIPEISIDANVFAIRGDGTPDAPVIIANFKLAQGAGIKTQDTKFTDAKIVTHGINFDINKADIKPESMGTINAIVDILKKNPGIKFEIHGHTDNTGNGASNLSLSQKRADAVKQQMISLGIDQARLTTKGMGDTKPISDNSTLEGKANNRRVEFITTK